MAQYRKDSLSNNNYYHIYSRSIAKYVIFNNAEEYSRMLKLIDHLKFCDFNYQYSQFIKIGTESKKRIINKLKEQNNTWVNIISYCLMPTHFHLILKQNQDEGITKYMAKILNSYSKYFNTIHQRSGPLWSARFKNIRIEDDEQLLHLTRYIHLNPASAKLVSKPEDWEFSSYLEYLKKTKNSICNHQNEIEITTKEYKKFVNQRKDYQQQLSQIKHLIIENYSG